MSRVSKNTLIQRSDRNMAAGTHPVVRESALAMVDKAYDEGINVQISEGHRSYARQNELYAQGRTKPGKIVTNARGGQSWHNFGIAVDFFLTNHDGSKALWTVNSKWRRAAQIGKSFGFNWGGDWTSFKDYPHLQMNDGLSMAQLRAGRKPNLKSRVNNPIKVPSGSGSSSGSSSSSSSISWKKVTGNWEGQTLRRGQHGTPVIHLQQMLANNYFYPEKGAKKDGVDGYYGDNTVDAVKRYQSIQGLTEDGIAGKDTYNSLKGNTKPPKDVKPSSKPKPKPSGGGAWTTQVLRTGSKGSAVRELQNLLVANNFYPNINASNNGVDGHFGPNTQDAVRRFQMMNGLSIDGIAGPATKRKLTGGSASSIKPSSKPASKKWTGRTLRPGDKGQEVRDLQNMLVKKNFYPNIKAKNNSVDGHYGPNTQDAVKRFQLMNGLTRDGLAGQATYRALNK